MDYPESSHALGIKPDNNDLTFMLYHQRKANGCPDYDN